MAKPFADLKKIKNRYCLCTSTHIYDHVLQLDILKKNFFAKYPEIEFKFGVRKQIKDFRIDEILADKGIDINEIIDNLENVSTVDEFDEIASELIKNMC